MGESWSKSVFSSMAQEIAYDADNEEMIVTWANGRRSAYSGVPEDLAISISKAPSVGHALNSEIKNQFPHRYV